MCLNGFPGVISDSHGFEVREKFVFFSQTLGGREGGRCHGLPQVLDTSHGCPGISLMHLVIIHDGLTLMIQYRVVVEWEGSPSMRRFHDFVLSCTTVVYFLIHGRGTRLHTSSSSHPHS